MPTNTDDQQRTITAELKELLGPDREQVERDLVAYYDWMRREGKVSKKQNSERRKPLAKGTVDNYHYHIDRAFRLVIDRLDPADKTHLTHDQADLIVKWLDENEIRKRSGEPFSASTKRKMVNALQKYFEWRCLSGEADKKWESNIEFSDDQYEKTDRLSFTERAMIREAATEHHALPGYYDVDDERRDEINATVAQRLGKPKDELEPMDWERADVSNKIGSLVNVGLDVGITPIEVEEAREDWYDPKKNELTIPEEYASKDRSTSTQPLTESTGRLLRAWLHERRHYEEYDETDRIWLNNEGNPYNSSNLCYLVRRLCDEVGIDHENRKIVWYSLRHNLGQTVREVADLAEASEHLRHSGLEITHDLYSEASVEKRRHTLEKIQELSRRSLEDPDFNVYEALDESILTILRSNDPVELLTNDRHQGEAHVDVTIDNTPSARMQLARDLLAEEDEDQHSNQA